MKLFRLVGQPVSIKAAAADGPARFSMLAYTGAAMDLGWGNPVYVSLAGMDAKSLARKTPIFRDHKPDQVVGHAESATIDAAGLQVAGVISGAGAHAAEIVASSKAGFPWQASIGATADKVREVKEGESANVNGRRIAGPAYIVVASKLKEISVVSLGADDATHTTIAASNAAAKPERMFSMQFDVWLKARGLELSALTDVQAAALRKDFDKEGAAAEKAAAKKDDTAADGTSIEAKAIDPAIEIRAKAAAEVARVNAIGKLCAAAPQLETEVDGKKVNIHAHAIGAGWTPTETELAIVRAERSVDAAGRSYGPAIHVRQHGPADAKVIEAAVCQTLLLPNIEKHYKPEVLEAADRDYRGLGLQRLLLLCASLAGYACSVGQKISTGNLRDILAYALPPRHVRAGAAMSTLSLPGILSTVANKALLTGYMEEDQTWKECAEVTSVPDFKTVTRYRLLDDMSYEQVGPNGELAHGKLGEESYTNRAKTYGKMLTLTREMIVNDDMGALNDLRTKIGRGGSKKFGDVFWTAFMANHSTFFTTARTNYITGATTNLGTDGVGLGLAVKAFRQMLSPSADGAKRVGVGMTPKILLVPPELEVIADQLFIAANGASVEVAKANTFAGKYRPVCQNRLSESAFTGYSTTAFYLIADTMKPMVVSYLNGQQTPTVESAEADFDTLGIQIRAYHDFGCDQGEYLSVLKSKGAA